MRKTLATILMLAVLALGLSVASAPAAHAGSANSWGGNARVCNAGAGQQLATSNCVIVGIPGCEVKLFTYVTNELKRVYEWDVLSDSFCSLTHPAFVATWRKPHSWDQVSFVAMLDADGWVYREKPNAANTARTCYVNRHEHTVWLIDRYQNSHVFNMSTGAFTSPVWSCVR